MSTLFITNLWRNPYFFFCAAFFVIFSICCHEFMHAYIALKVGDATAANSGHLTLNPLKQMGLWSLLLFAFFGLAWGAVPVNPRANYRIRHGAALVAAAGPLTNFVLSIAFLFLVIVCIRSNIAEEPIRMIYYGAVLNMVLFILNLIPIPGFDGSVLLADFFPQIKRILSTEKGVAGAVILMFLLFSCFDYLYKAAGFLCAVIFAVFEGLFL